MPTATLAPATRNGTRPKTGASPPRPRMNTHLLLVSPTQARDLLQEAYPQQRPLRPHHVAFLQGLIEGGHLRPGTTISFARLGAQRLLINGQHTLTALGQTSGGPVWLQIEEIRVDSLEAVGWLYESYDRNLARSWGDLFRADTGLQQGAMGPTQMKWLSGAITLLAEGFARTHGFAGPRLLLRNPRLRLPLMQAWQDELLNFCDGIVRCRAGNRKLLVRAAVLAVVLVTYRFQPEAAHVFWPSLARDSGLKDGDPTKALLEWLRESPANKLNPPAYTRVVAAGWNAAFEGREVHILRGRDAAAPLLLQGTPHDGKAHYRYVDAHGQPVHTPVVVDD